MNAIIPPNQFNIHCKPGDGTYNGIRVTTSVQITGRQRPYEDTPTLELYNPYHPDASQIHIELPMTSKPALQKAIDIWGDGYKKRGETVEPFCSNKKPPTTK